MSRKPARLAVVVVPLTLLLSGLIGPSLAGAAQQRSSSTASTSRTLAPGKIQNRHRIRTRAPAADSRPNVTWQTPAAGQTVSGVLNETNGNCRAAASDDVGIHHVDFYLDGALLNRELGAPYACKWNTAASATGSHVLKAVAFDAAGNSRSASIAVAVRGSSPSNTRITGTTYYVSSSGTDSNSGLSPSAAWRTVAKANVAAVRPGDGVLFEGSRTFSDSALSPSRSGTATARVVYGSYGTGKAILPKGIYMYSVGGLAFQNLAISSTNQAVAASGRGSGSPDITLEGLTITNVGIGVHSANWGDVRWTIRDNTISQTGDSGMILYGSDFLVSGNSITDTGTNSSIPYGKHAIYLKVIGARVTANTIRRFQGNGVSVRYRNSIVDNNVIADGAAGIAWFQYDPSAGKSNWHHNTISGTTAAGIYVSPSDHGRTTRESFVITDNTLSKNSGVYTDLKSTTGTYTVARNIMR